MMNLAQAAAQAVTGDGSGSAPGARPARDLNFSDYWGSSNLLDVRLILLALAVILTALGLWILWRRHRTRDERSHPAAIYRQIATELGLSLRDQWRLARLSRAQSLPTPIALLLSPATLAYHASAQAQSLGAEGGQRFMARIDRICREVYGQPLPAPSDKSYDDADRVTRRA